MLWWFYSVWYQLCFFVFFVLFLPFLWKHFLQRPQVFPPCSSQTELACLLHPISSSLIHYIITVVTPPSTPQSPSPTQIHFISFQNKVGHPGITTKHSMTSYNKSRHKPASPGGGRKESLEQGKQAEELLIMSQNSVSSLWSPNDWFPCLLSSLWEILSAFKDYFCVYKIMHHIM